MPSPVILKKTTFLLVLSLMLSCRCIAQITISGTAINDQTEAIAFATVTLQNITTDKLEDGTITNEKGEFSLAIHKKGIYQLSISYLGYTDYQKQITVEESVNLGALTLEASANLLEEVVVSADRSIIEQKEDRLIFNVGSSPLKSGFDGMEILQRSPNIWVDEKDGILMRNEAATILINGRKIQGSGADLANYIRNMRSEDIQAIEIQTNLSANADGESSGGIVNIVLKKKAKGFKGSIRAYHTFRGDEFNTDFGGFNWNYGAQNWNLYGNYNLFQNSKDAVFLSEIFYNTNLDYLRTDRVTGDTLNRQNYQLGFVVEPRKNHLFGLEVFGTSTDIVFNNNSLVKLSNGNDLLADGRTLFFGDSEKEIINATANYAWKIDTLNSQLRFFMDYTQQEVFQNNLAESVYELGVFPDTIERNGSDAATQIYALQTDWIKHFTTGLKLETGLKLTNTQRENSLLSEFFADNNWVANDRTTDFNYDEQVLAAYVSLGKQLDEKHYLKAGLRVENTNLNRIDLLKNTRNGQHYTSWLPSFYLSRKLNNKQSLSLSYSKRIRRPSFSFLNNNVRKINDFRYELGNPDLAPEQVHKIDLSLNQQKQTFSLYYVQSNDAVNGIFFLEEEVVYYQKVNAGAQKQFGLEYNRFGNLKPWWYIKATGLVYHRKFTNEEGEDMFQQVTTYLRLSNNFKINTTTNFDLSAYYISPRADAFYLAAERYSINLMLQKTFFKKKLICRIYLNDPFNQLIYINERVFEDFKTTNSRKPRTRVLKLWAAYNFATKNKVNARKNKSKNEARRRL